MATKDEARVTADERAKKELLEEYDVKVVDKDAAWVFQYTPKARVRGSGFEIAVSKSTGKVTELTRYQ
jgi:hypothetical protein